MPNLIGVTDLSAMFKACTLLNGPANIGSWNVSNVDNLSSMFQDATAFNKSLGNWTLKWYVNLSALFTDSGLDCFHYSETLKGWSANPNTPYIISLNADGRTYSPSAVNARNYLIEELLWDIVDDAASATECADPLPVSLVSFSGQKNNENQNVLKWATVDEVNFDRFEIQRSVYASGFQTIGVVPGQKESYDPSDGASQNQVMNRYTFTDPAPVSAQYYRLRMVDKDGSFAFSRIIFLDNPAAKPAVGSFYPNPSSGKVWVDVHVLESGPWILTVVDVSGKITGRRTYDLKKGKNTLSLENFGHGVNLVRFENGPFLQVRKLVRD